MVFGTGLGEVAACASQCQSRGPIEVGDNEILDLSVSGSAREESVKMFARAGYPALDLALLTEYPSWA